MDALSDRVKSLILGIVKYFYILIFQQAPGNLAENIIKKIAWAISGSLIAAVFIFIFNVLAIRYLGPVEYGKWNLIVSFAQFIMIPMLWGMGTATLRQLGADKKDSTKSIVGTSFITLIVLSLIFGLFFFLIKNNVVSWLSIPSQLYQYAIGYAFILAFFTLPRHLPTFHSPHWLPH